jgi:hypothetical protein
MLILFKLTERNKALQGYEDNWVSERFLESKSDYDNRESRRKRAGSQVKWELKTVEEGDRSCRGVLLT